MCTQQGLLVGDGVATETCLSLAPVPANLTMMCGSMLPSHPPTLDARWVRVSTHEASPKKP